MLICVACSDHNSRGNRAPSPCQIRKTKLAASSMELGTSGFNFIRTCVSSIDNVISHGRCRGWRTNQTYSVFSRPIAFFTKFNMLLMLEEQHKKHLSFLTSVEIDGNSRLNICIMT